MKFRKFNGKNGARNQIVAKLNTINHILFHQDFRILFLSSMFITALFIIAISWEQTRCPSTKNG